MSMQVKSGGQATNSGTYNDDGRTAGRKERHCEYETLLESDLLCKKELRKAARFRSGNASVSERQWRTNIPLSTLEHEDGCCISLVQFKDKQMSVIEAV